MVVIEYPCPNLILIFVSNSDPLVDTISLGQAKHIYYPFHLGIQSACDLNEVKIFFLKKIYSNIISQTGSKKHW